MKEKLITLLKFSFAALIITWLFNSGKLDFSLITKSFGSGYFGFYAIFILLIQDCLSAVRWRMILKLNSNKKLPYLDMIRVTWIGLFFNSFLPGAVTGDLIKLLYARDLDRDISKTYLVTSVLIDRIFGLIGLLCILGTSSLFYYSEVTALGPQMKNLIHFNLLLFVGAIFFIISLFLPTTIQNLILSLTIKVPFIGEKINKTLEQAWIVGSHKKVVILSILLSTFLQFISFVAFYLLSFPFYGQEVPLSNILTFIPIGFMAVAVPISPAGLGVGHVIFDQLYQMIGIEGGASFFNLYFLCLVCVNSLGFFPYMFSGKKHSLAETKEFEDIK